MVLQKLWCIGLLLLATTGGLLLALARDDLAQHDNAIAVHEGNAREALAIFERVANQRLLRLKAALRHLVRLQRVRILKLLATLRAGVYRLEGARTRSCTNP